MIPSKMLILSVFLILIMCIGVFVAAPLTVSAADVIDSGTCGDDLTWILTSDGTLTISGEGEMRDYSGANTSPWYSYCDSITSIVIENDVTSIGRDAFWDCTDLISVTIGNSVTTIDFEAFYDCTSLTSITIPDSVTSIGSEAFENCTSLEVITLPDIETTIGRRAFYNTSYYNDEDNWEDGVLYIDNCLIEADSEVVSGDYTVKPGTVGIASEAFSYCASLTSVTIGDTVTTIGHDAFFYCTSLESITIPDSVTKIGDSAFYNCTSLTSVTIGSGVTSIKDDAFANCTSLIEIYFEGDAPSMRNGGGAFYRVTATAYYPAENDTWTEDVMLNYGGTIAWTAYTVSIAADAADNAVTYDEVESDIDDDTDDNNNNDSNDNDANETTSGCGSSFASISVIFAFAACCLCVRRKESTK